MIYNMWIVKMCYNLKKLFLFAFIFCQNMIQSKSSKRENNSISDGVCLGRNENLNGGKNEKSRGNI